MCKGGLGTHRSLLDSYQALKLLQFMCQIGEPTNFGLLKSRQGDWRTQIASESDGSFNTTYSASYMPVPSSARVRIRFATSRDVSTPLHRQNKINKDIHFRGIQKYLSPETIGSPVGLTCQTSPMSQSIVY